MHNYEELIDKIDKTAAAFSNHLGDNNMSDFLREPIKAIKQLVAERDELLAALKEIQLSVPSQHWKCLLVASEALAKAGADKIGEV